LIIFETKSLHCAVAVKDPEGVVFEYPVEDQEAAGISTIIDRASALGTLDMPTASSDVRFR
jgi:hypothetical protein